MTELTDAEHAEWDEFVYGEKNGSIFHTTWWHKAWDAEYRVFARRDRQGRIESGILIHIARFPSFSRFGVKGIRRPPLTPVNGPVFRPCPKQGRCNWYTHEKKELHSSIDALPRVDFYDFGLGRAFRDIMPFLWNGFDTHISYTYVIPFSEAATWQKNISEKTKRKLKAARKEAAETGCRIETDPPFMELKPLFFETGDTKGFSMSRYEAALPKWWAAMKDMNAGRSYILRDKGGKGLCASLMVWDNRTAYVLLNGMMRDMRRDTHVNMLLFERMITDALDMGLDFDFDGSILMGVERFFRGWGGELHQKFRVTKIPSALAYIGWKSWWYFKFHKKRGWVSPV